MRKWHFGAAGVLVLAMAAFFLLSRALDKSTVLDPPPPGTVRVHFSDGRVVLCPTSKLDEFKWVAIKAQTYHPTLTKKLTLAAARFAGLRKYPVSDPATLVGLESHLKACGQYTQQSFYLHEQFAEHLGQLTFYFGGTEHARTPAEWVEANLNSIRTNHVAIGPKGSRNFVSCAIAVAHDSIRIIPESILFDQYAQSSGKP